MAEIFEAVTSGNHVHAIPAEMKTEILSER